MLHPRDRLPVQTEGAIEFWPCHEVAVLATDHGSRLRVVHRDGRVAHRPGPFPVGPWRALEGVLVHPAHVQGGRDPAGFPVPVGPVDPLPPLEPEAPLPSLGVSPQEVLFLQARGGQAWWHTDGGPIPAGVSAQEASQLHPHLVPAGRGTFVNRRRLARIAPERKRFRLTLDDATELTVSWGAREGLASALDLPHLYHLEPYPEPLYREGLRDWPLELAAARSDFLKHHFADGPRRLIANLIWQTFRLPERPDYGVDHRGFWYVPLVATLSRAGYLEPGWLTWEPPDDLRELDPQGPAGLYLLYQTVLGQLVGEDALLTFAELGFEDPRPDLRHIGSDVVVVAEKTSLNPFVRRLADEFGVSTIVLGGLPALVSTEYFARALPWSSVRLVAYVDFDPGGWIAAESFAQQLRRYGVECTDPVYMVRPSRFTPEEIELYSLPIPMSTPQIRGKVKAWLAKSGGIDGRARALHADHLRPVGRVLEAFTAASGSPGRRARRAGKDPFR